MHFPDVLHTPKYDAVVLQCSAAGGTTEVRLQRLTCTTANEELLIEVRWTTNERRGISDKSTKPCGVRTMHDGAAAATRGASLAAEQQTHAHTSKVTPKAAPNCILEKQKANRETKSASLYGNNKRGGRNTKILCLMLKGAVAAAL